MVAPCNTCRALPHPIQDKRSVGDLERPREADLLHLAHPVLRGILSVQSNQFLEEPCPKRTKSCCYFGHRKYVLQKLWTSVLVSIKMLFSIFISDPMLSENSMSTKMVATLFGVIILVLLLIGSTLTLIRSCGPKRQQSSIRYGVQRSWSFLPSNKLIFNSLNFLVNLSTIGVQFTPDSVKYFGPSQLEPSQKWGFLLK